MTDIEITELNRVDAEEVRQWTEARNASILADLPHFPPASLPGDHLGLFHTRKAERKIHLLAKIDGRVAGAADISLPQIDNRHLVEFELEVDPAFRRRGVGRALLDRVLEAAKAEGRTVVTSFVPDTLTEDSPRNHAGQRLLESYGFVKGLDEIRRTADLDLVPESELDELLAKAWTHAEGYEVVSWINHAPDDVVDGVAYLSGRLNTDAPIGDMAWEPETFDADRRRDGERQSAALGTMRVNTVLRKKDDGAVAAWTEIFVGTGNEHHCFQGITIVDPDHRGHRLGTIAKIVNHRWLREWRPRMKYVHTWNAEVNGYMISINEALGYRAQERWLAMQLDLEK